MWKACGHEEVSRQNDQHWHHDQLLPRVQAGAGRPRGPSLVLRQQMGAGEGDSEHFDGWD